MTQEIYRGDVILSIIRYFRGDTDEKNDRRPWEQFKKGEKKAIRLFISLEPSHYIIDIAINDYDVVGKMRRQNVGINPHKIVQKR